MSLATRTSPHPTWAHWASARDFAHRRASETAQVVVTFVLQRAARRTLQRLERIDDRLLACAGLNRTALAELMREIAEQA